jgi:hypothetical protein
MKTIEKLNDKETDGHCIIVIMVIKMSINYILLFPNWLFSLSLRRSLYKPLIRGGATDDRDLEWIINRARFREATHPIREFLLSST